MKYFLLSTAFVFIFFHSSIAQITITQNDFPRVGDSWSFTDWDGQNSLDVGASGAGKTWRFNNVSSEMDTLTFQSVTGIPGADSFPGANLAAIADGLSFFTSSDSGFYADGFYDGDSSYDMYTNKQLLVPAPFTFGDSRIHLYKEVSLFYNNQNYEKDTYSYTDLMVADAFGHITTPFVTNVPTLRVKLSEVEHDSVFLSSSKNGPYSLNSSRFSNNNSFYFVKNGLGLFVLIVDVDQNDSTQDATFFNSNFINAVPTLPRPSLYTRLYPNPANGLNITISIHGNNASLLNVYNMLGENMLSENVQGMNELKLSGNAWKSGVYYYSITDSNGNILGGQKFIVQ